MIAKRDVRDPWVRVGLESVTILFPLETGSLDVKLDSIAVQAVPVPAAVWLLHSALAGLGWLRRRQPS